MDNKIILALGGGLALLLLFVKKSKAGEKLLPKASLTPLPATKTPDIQVGKHFRLQEFLRSTTFPELDRYRPSANDLSNLKLLVGSILEPIRVKYGTVIITGGGRPEYVAKLKGTTWYDALKKKGFTSARQSDHTDFSAVDFKPSKVTTVDAWKSLIKDIRDNPNVRQVGFYLKKGADGTASIAHVHVAVIAPGHPKITSANHEYWNLDGKPIKVPTAFA